MFTSVLRLWNACRLPEGGWSLLDPETIDLNRFSDGTAQIPNPLDAQIGSLFMSQILEPLRLEVLKNLQTLLRGRAHRDWVVGFVTAYILLHSCEMLVRQQADVAKQREWPLRFTNMPLIGEIHVGSNKILEFFHRANDNRMPFQMKWADEKDAIISQFSQEERELMVDVTEDLKKGRSNERSNMTAN
jgi:hypothetical protein